MSDDKFSIVAEPQHCLLRLATLVASVLFKRQVERVAIPNQRLFTEENEALAWLFSPNPAA